MAVITNRKDLATFAKNVVEYAAKKRIDIRIFGSIGIDILNEEHCGFINENTTFKDIDFIARISQLHMVDSFLKGIRFELAETDGYRRNGDLRVYYGNKRDFGCDLKLDVYFGVLSFNHEIPGPYFEANQHTISVTQLLISKLAIVALTEKDKMDVVRILNCHKLEEGNKFNIISKDALRKMWSTGFAGWELSQTCRKNLILLLNSKLEDSTGFDVNNVIKELILLMDESSKSAGWKLRKLLGKCLPVSNHAQANQS